MLQLSELESPFVSCYVGGSYPLSLGLKCYWKMLYAEWKKSEDK